MFRTVRAAGFAVAAITMAGAAMLAQPTLASEGEAHKAQPRYSDHESAGTEYAALALNTFDKTNPPVAFGTDLPVIQHAVATADDEVLVPDLRKDEEEAPVLSLSELVNEHAGADVPDAEHECLAIAVYYESKSESLQGQLTVAEVIKNRSESGRFPSSICGVVKQRGQFSFVRGGRLPEVRRNSSHWRTAVAIAHIALNELASGEAPRALFFHARHASPGWKLTRVATVGNHVFYR